MKTPAFYEIPAGAKPTGCRGKDCTISVYWGKTPAGRPIPLSCEREGSQHPTAVAPGRGVSHHIDCPNADDFRRDRKAKRP